MAGSTQEFAIKAELPTVSTAHAGYWLVVWRRFKQHRVAYVGFFFFVLLLVAVVIVRAHADALRKALVGHG